MRPRAGEGSPCGRIEADYDLDPQRFAANQAATRRLVGSDVHEVVARRLAEESPGWVLDLGGGNGDLARQLQPMGVDVVTLDPAQLVRQAPPPQILSRAEQLPLRAGSVGAVAALWMLYHVEDLDRVLREVVRVLRPGGLLAACTSSRFNDPELSGLLPGWGEPFQFDAEQAEDRLAGHLEIVDQWRWDAPLVELTDRESATLFLRGRGLAVESAEQGAAQLSLPVRVTKRGAVIWARRRP